MIEWSAPPSAVVRRQELTELEWRLWQEIEIQIEVGGGFDEATVQAVWNKGKIVQGYDSSTWRKDACGAFIKRAAYGTTETHGWEVDHIKPIAQGGGDDLANLQPFQWENNRHKGDDWPNWQCAVTS